MIGWVLGGEQKSYSIHVVNDPIDKLAVPLPLEIRTKRSLFRGLFRISGI